MHDTLCRWRHDARPGQGGHDSRRADGEGLVDHTDPAGAVAVGIPPVARTSRAWWDETKRDDVCLLAWLQKQHHGEATAAERIRRYCVDAVDALDPRRKVLLTIAEQEDAHAAWIAELLRSRGETPAAIAHPERYWRHALAALSSFDDAAGAAYHAEAMRLERIEVIATDPAGPADLRAVFARILRDERFHARAFRRLASAEAIERTRGAHRAGARAIGFLSDLDDEGAPAP